MLRQRFTHDQKTKHPLVVRTGGHPVSGGWLILLESLGNRNTRLYDGFTHQWTLEKRPVTPMRMEQGRRGAAGSSSLESMSTLTRGGYR